MSSDISSYFLFVAIVRLPSSFFRPLVVRIDTYINYSTLKIYICKSIFVHELITRITTISISFNVHKSHLVTRRRTLRILAVLAITKRRTTYKTIIFLSIEGTHTFYTCSTNGRWVRGALGGSRFRRGSTALFPFCTIAILGLISIV